MANKRQKLATDAVWEHYRSYLDSIDEDNSEGDIDEIVEIIENIEILRPKKDNKILSKDTWMDPSFRLSVLYSASSSILADYFMAQSDGDKTVVDCLRKAILFFDGNANAWSLAANYGRVRGHPEATEWYQKAIQSAVELRKIAIDLLEDDEVPEKEWIELLLLNQMIGVELMDDEEDDEEEEEAEEEVDGKDEWSPSAVEATARFMAAMQLSTANKHESALEHLKHFDLTHRIHPNVWNDINASNETAEDVVAYDNVIPAALYESLCELFAPDAIYWQESDYENRGYYSYFIPRSEGPSTLIDKVIAEYLLPLVEENTNEKIVGFEWWVHHRPTNASLGHNLHFDTDEALLAQEGKVTHPVCSSVLYLTGNNKGGATIILDQTPHSKENAKFAYKSVPKNNRFLLFPGDRLHGVLPCPQSASASKEASLDCLSEPTVQGEYRLTFMVGFWARNVPEKMKERKLYGPCGPMPDRTEKWVEQSHIIPSISQAAKPVKCSIPIVSPVWEKLSGTGEFDLPKVVDHRFFVKDSPRCFYDSLFEKDEYDEDEGY